MIATPENSVDLESAKRIETQSTRQIKALFLLIGATMFALIFTHFSGVPVAIRLAVTYLTPVLLLMSLMLVASLCKQAPQTTSRLWLVIGLFLVIGGIAFDIIATIIHSPDLAREGNVVAVRLFESGHSLQFVYIYGLLCQFLLAVTSGYLWTALVRHSPVMFTLIAKSNPTSYVDFVKASFGGQAMTWRQILFTKSWQELSLYKPYPLFWSTTFLLTVSGLYRWYLGLEWFQLVPWLGGKSGAVTTLLGVVVYFLWLRYEYQKFRSHI